MKAIILDMYGVIVKQTGDEFVSERVCSRPIGCLGKHIILSWCGSCDIAIPFIRGLKSGESGLCCHSSNYLEPFSSVYFDVLSGSDSVLVRLNGGYSA